MCSGPDWKLASEKRSTWKFLEPSSRLICWSATRPGDDAPHWEPSEDGPRAPWPVPSNLWLYTYTVFLDRMVYRPLTNKEWAQLFDLRPEWGEHLRQQFESWRAGQSLPLRFTVELALRAANWSPKLKQTTSPTTSRIHFGRTLVHPVLSGGPESEAWNLKNYFGWVWEPEDAEENQVATTADEAGVKYHLWAIGGDHPSAEKARTVMRAKLWSVWMRKITREGAHWLRRREADPGMTTETRARNRDALVDCITRLAGSDWFEWGAGSRLHFWRFPERWLEEARDGSKAHVISRPPPRYSFRKPNKPKEDPQTVRLDAEKLAKVIRRGYLEIGQVRVVCPRFSIPKGDDDIRVVWDSTKNDVNDGVFASSFYLLGISAVVPRLHPNDWIGDFDVGEMFHNFPMHESEREYCGVHLDCDTRAVLKELLGTPKVPQLMRWSRLLFGWRCSPFKAVSMMNRIIELIRRTPEDKSSAFQFDSVILNLPGSKGYDPSRPRIIKTRVDGLVACDIYVFVDDGRVKGPTEELTRQALRQATAGIQRYGIQDAPRKREAPSQRPRVWTGGVVYTDNGTVRKFITRTKWAKLKQFVEWTVSGPTLLDRKRFESGLGFLVHITATYDFLRPYLVGFYLALNNFRGDDRNEDGWKNADPDGSHVIGPKRPSDEEGVMDDLEELEERLGRALEEGADGELSSPITADQMSPLATEPWASGTKRTIDPVRVTPLLLRNATSILALIEGDDPVRVLVHPVKSKEKVNFAGSDASGEGYGGRDDIGRDGGNFFFGYWSGLTDDETSNWREMRAVLDKIRDDAVSGRLSGRELWFATDNSVLERAYYKGYSSSPRLYAMVEELRALTIRGNFILKIVHIAGTRMIDTGIDGLSRGDLDLGLLSVSLRELIPLHLTPSARSPRLLNWVTEMTTKQANLATAMDWHHLAHQPGALTLDAKPETWIWDLQPAAALYALEELALARTKRRDLLQGIVLVPALMMPEWYRRFSKVVDIFFRIPAGSIPAWPKAMHEPLTIGLYFPTFRTRPWDWREVSWMGKLGRTLSAMFKEDVPRAGNLLHEFWAAAHGIPNLSTDMVRRLLCCTGWQPLLDSARRRRRRERAHGDRSNPDLPTGTER